jgi:hypothetical protein
LLKPVEIANIMRDNSIPTDEVYRQIRARALAWVYRYYLETLLALEIVDVNQMYIGQELLSNGRFLDFVEDFYLPRGDDA